MSENTTITKYAIIDQIGFLDAVYSFEEYKVSLASVTEKRSDATTALMYEIVRDMAKADGYEEATYTLKQACREYANNEHLEPTKKFKNFMRYNLAPEKVYILCNDEEDEAVKSAISIWSEHNHNIEVISTNPFEKANQLYYIDNWKRRITEIWAPSIGWTFSAPIAREPKPEAIDLFAKRPDFKFLVKKDPNHVTKILSNPRTYRRANRMVASDTEIDAFIEHLEFLASKANGHIDHTTGAFTGDTDIMTVFLDIDYKICTECHRPRNIKNDKDDASKHTKYSICPHCGKKYKHELIWYPYYDDTSLDD